MTISESAQKIQQLEIDYHSVYDYIPQNITAEKRLELMIKLREMYNRLAVVDKEALDCLLYSAWKTGDEDARFS